MTDKLTDKLNYLTAFPLHFWKIEGAQNDFILFEGNPENLATEVLRETIVRITKAHSGVGADGVIFCWSGREGWNWRYWNADGSETKLCGNAARCVALWLMDVKKLAADKCAWLGVLGKFEARKSFSDEIEVTWPLPEGNAEAPLPEVLFDLMSGYNDHGLAAVQLFQVGVPHLVLSNHEVWNVEQRFACNDVLRRHPSLGPEGANVTWISLKTMEVVTYERGIEDETRACGSGALAAFLALEAYAKMADHEATSQRTLRFPGGPLTVKREGRRLWLAGPTHRVFEADLVG